MLDTFLMLRPRFDARILVLGPALSASFIVQIAQEFDIYVLCVYNTRRMEEILSTSQSILHGQVPKSPGARADPRWTTSPLAKYKKFENDRTEDAMIEDVYTHTHPRWHMITLTDPFWRRPQDNPLSRFKPKLTTILSDHWPNDARPTDPMFGVPPFTMRPSDCGLHDHSTPLHGLGCSAMLVPACRLV